MITFKFLTIVGIVLYFAVFGLTCLFTLFVGVLALDSAHVDISAKGFFLWLAIVVISAAAVAFGVDMLHLYKPEIQAMFK